MSSPAPPTNESPEGQKLSAPTEDKRLSVDSIRDSSEPLNTITTQEKGERLEHKEHETHNAAIDPTKNVPSNALKEETTVGNDVKDEEPEAWVKTEHSAAGTEDQPPRQTTLAFRLKDAAASPGISRDEAALNGKLPVTSPSPPPPPPKDEKYRDRSASPSKLPPLDTRGKGISQGDEGDDLGQQERDTEEEQDDSKSEIQSIMDQFGEGMNGPGMDEIMSPRLEVAGPKFGSPVSHPPRKSSLEPVQSNTLSHLSEESGAGKGKVQSHPPRGSSLSSNSLQTEKTQYEPTPSSGSQGSVLKPPPPDPEPDLPFDFHRFLEQLRHRTADPVARFLRSFLLEFGKKQWMVHEQVKIISDFLEFISKKMAQCEVWRVVSDAEFENAKEGMEKLVMNRLYTHTFSPAIPPPEPSLKGRRRAPQNPEAPGRRGQHQEDVERDEVLEQKVRIYQWVNEEHLDIPIIGEKGRKFLQLAQQELLKIKSYRAPRDKVICVLNCCKVIFGFLRNQQTKDTSADSFVPLLIYTVLQANPEHLVSNVQYILRFRNQDKLNGEAGYYMSSLMGAVQFIENLDRTTLTISDADFEKNVEAAVSAIAERHRASEEALAEQSIPSSSSTASARTPGHQRRPSPHMHLPEKSSLARAEVTPRHSLDAEHVPPRRRPSQAAAKAVEKDGSGDDEADAVSGLLRTIRSPLSTIGRIFGDETPPTSSHQQQHPALTPQPAATPARLTPNTAQTQQHAPRLASEDGKPLAPRNVSTGHAQQMQRMSAEDAAARQASAETEEARKLQAKEHRTVVETLAGMFPSLDREIIDDVVREKQGRVGLAVDACLRLTSES